MDICCLCLVESTPAYEPPITTAIKHWFQTYVKKGGKESIDKYYVKMRIEVGESHQAHQRETFRQLRETDSRNPLIEVPDTFAPTNGEDSPKRVLVKGRAGMGKTTLVKKILIDWSDNNLWKEEFEYIHWFEFRNLNETKEISYCDLLRDCLKKEMLSPKQFTVDP